MANTAEDWVYVPDESTAFNINTILGTMASSIEDTAGPHIFEAETTATPTDTVNFRPYSSGGTISLIRTGKYVSVSGAWACTTANYLSGTTDRKFASVPVGFRPRNNFYQIMQGSGSSSWLLLITAAGVMSAARVSGNQGANYWMPMSVTYLAET